MGFEKFSEFTKNRFLLCEGDDDKRFFQKLIKEHHIPDFQVHHSAECNQKQIGGKTGFKESLDGMELLKGFSELKTLLLVADNDTIGATFAEAQKSIRVNGGTPPTTPGEIGTFFGKPVAILMIPSSDMDGDLEKLCLPSIHEKWPRSKCCVNFFLRCTGATSWHKQSSINKARARSATVGFNEDDPYKGIGILFENGTLSVHNSCFDGIVSFLKGFDRMCGIAVGGGTSPPVP